MTRLHTAMIREEPQRDTRAYTPVIVAMCASFHTAAVLGGFNLSLADIFLLLFFAALLVDRKLEIPRGPSIYVLLLTASAVFTSLGLVPQMLGVDPDFAQIIGGLIKLAISFLFFVAGWTVARMGLVGAAVKSFALGGMLAALLGIATLAVPAPVLETWLYYDNFRYRGFMSDPNFYALLTCAAFVAVASDPRPMLLRRLVVLIVLGFGVLLSGSKAGLLTLLFAFAVSLLARSTPRNRPALLTFATLISAMLLILAKPILTALVDFFDWLENFIPQAGRLSVLVTGNLIEGLSEGGSVRNEVWGTAFEMLRQSPLLGVGVGNYLNVSSRLHDLHMVAHNTYLQILVEWGPVFALPLFAWLVVVLVRASKGPNADVSVKITRNVVLVLLFGSVSLSLNNARMLWFFLGVLAAWSASARAGTPAAKRHSAQPNHELRS